MSNLREHVTVLRSKNANPYEFTLDVIFKSPTEYKQAKQSNLFESSTIADLYDISEEAVRDVIYYDPADAVKVTIERQTVSGNIGDTDVYGAQQYAPLLSLELPNKSD